MDYPMTIAGVSRRLPLCPVGDDLFIGAFVIFGDVELTRACAAALLEKAPAHDIIITAESKGIPLVYEMARQSGENAYIVARKAEKLYMKNVFSTTVKSITTSQVQTLFIDGEDMERMRGKRVLLIDDVISTGESLKALEKLVTEAGGEIAAKMAILAEGKAAGRSDIIFLEKLPLFRGDGSPVELQ
ncbi:adenine phosphoribosyltransferase [Oscillospiraceae bacterium OttesenSCG-928-F05]|nr:adenine phosphoribosyltransferase [Oscillospiraceae bacterium OttesenSCG-928-F05]